MLDQMVSYWNQVPDKKRAIVHNYMLWQKISDCLFTIDSKDKFDAILAFFKDKFYIDLSDILSGLSSDDDGFIRGAIQVTSEIQRILLRHYHGEDYLTRLRSVMKAPGKVHDFFRFLFMDAGELDGVSGGAPQEANIRKLYLAASNNVTDLQQKKNQQEVANQYSHRYHFFFEFIQNAQDAGSSRLYVGPSKVHKVSCLIIANDGKKFSPMDAWGISSIGFGFKDSQKIGFSALASRAFPTCAPRSSSIRCHSCSGSTSTTVPMLTTAGISIGRHPPLTCRPFPRDTRRSSSSKRSTWTRARMTLAAGINDGRARSPSSRITWKTSTPNSCCFLKTSTRS